MSFGKTPEHTLTSQGQIDEDFATVHVAPAPNDEPALHQTIHEADHRVMSKQEPTCERSDGGALIVR